MRLAPETRIKIDDYIYNPDNSRDRHYLSLRGKIRASQRQRGVIPASGGGSTFDVHTPTAIAGVRGRLCSSGIMPA